jgi:hypothetical protein
MIKKIKLKIMNQIIKVFIALIVFPLGIYGQQTQTEIQNDILLISKGTPEGIALRWAPTNVRTWQMGIEHGYTIERMTVDTNIYLPLGPGIFKPLPASDWPKAAEGEEINYMHAAAKCMYESSNAKGFVNQAEDLSNRHTFHLMIADFDKEAAEASGLSFFDQDNSMSNLARYRIFSYDPVNNVSSDTFETIIGYYGEEPIIAPKLEIKEMDGAIKLFWSEGGQVESSSKLNAFHIERSTDGANYTRLNDQPFMNGITDLNPNNEFTVFIDSVENGIPYQYRVIGLDAFADQTNPSNVVKGMGIDLTPPSAVSKLTNEIIDNRLIRLNWEWNASSNDEDFMGFNVYAGLKKEGEFRKINKEILSKETRTFETEEILNPGFIFYYVEAVDENANTSTSLFSAALIVDDIAPGPPTNLTAEIDTNGMIFIQWDAPEDNDIQGYELHFANRIDYTYSKRAVPIIENEFFIDSTTLKTLTKDIFYKVVTVDNNLNRSEFSEVFKASRPDIIPPSASIFKDYISNEGVLEIHWIPSSSNDVVSIEMYKRSNKDRAWKIVADFDPSNRVYKDANVKGGVFYEYNLITKDAAGNAASPKTTLTLEGIKPFYLPTVAIFEAERMEETILLNWQYEGAENYDFIIYKSNANGDLVSYKNIDVTTSYTIPANESNLYSFAIMAKGADGRKSKLSEIVTLK